MRPSPKYPSLQTHSKDPAVFVQVPFTWQSWLSSLHSSTSVQEVNVSLINFQRAGFAFNKVSSTQSPEKWSCIQTKRPKDRQLMSTIQRSNAATARLLTLVRPAETQFSTRLTEHKHERPEMVISKTTMLNIIYRQEHRIDWVSASCVKYSTGHGRY